MQVNRNSIFDYLGPNDIHRQKIALHLLVGKRMHLARKKFCVGTGNARKSEIEHAPGGLAMSNPC